MPIHVSLARVSGIAKQAKPRETLNLPTNDEKCLTRRQMFTVAGASAVAAAVGVAFPRMFSLAVNSESRIPEGWAKPVITPRAAPFHLDERGLREGMFPRAQELDGQYLL